MGREERREVSGSGSVAMKAGMDKWWWWVKVGKRGGEVGRPSLGTLALWPLLAAAARGGWRRNEWWRTKKWAELVSRSCWEKLVGRRWRRGLVECSLIHWRKLTKGGRGRGGGFSKGKPLSRIFSLRCARMGWVAISCALERENKVERLGVHAASVG